MDAAQCNFLQAVGYTLPGQLLITDGNTVISYIHIEKAAGSTMDQVLRQSFGSNHCDIESWDPDWSGHDSSISASDLRRTRRLYRSLDSIAGHGVKPASDLYMECPDIQFFTMLREPLARCASHYQYQIKSMGKHIPFEEWIKDERYRNFQVKKIAGKDDLLFAKQVLRDNSIFTGLVEHFDESLVMLKKHFSHLHLKINYRRRNVATDTSIKDRLLVNDATRRALVEANTLDLELYEWVSEILYPEQVKNYGSSLENDVLIFQGKNNSKLPNVSELLSVIKRRLVYLPSIRIYKWCACHRHRD